MDMQTYLFALALILGVGVAAWAVSVAIRNVAFVDSLWSLFFLIAAVTFAAAAWPLSARGLLVTVLVAIWALRLSIYITARNWGEVRMTNLSPAQPCRAPPKSGAFIRNATRSTRIETRKPLPQPMI